MSSRVPSWSDMRHQVTELIWENGHLSMHGLATPPGGSGTLESIVNQAKASAGSSFGGFSVNDLVTCLTAPSSAADSSPVSGCDTCVTDLGSAEKIAIPCRTSNCEDGDSECVGRQQKIGREKEKKSKGKSSLSSKRSWVHNQSERRRRDKINQKIKTLQKLVPNSSKVDKASMLDEVIEYLKQLQAQVQMIGRVNMAPFMMPAAAGQLQMPLMTPMGIGFGLGMGIGMNNASPVLQPSATFMPQNTQYALDPTIITCPSQPMTLDAYSKMAALYRQQ